MKSYSNENPEGVPVEPTDGYRFGDTNDRKEGGDGNFVKDHDKAGVGPGADNAEPDELVEKKLEE